MRIIDDKGRIFGKVNIIDFLLLLVIFCLMSAFLVANKISIKSQKEMEKHKKVYTLTIRCPICTYENHIEFEKRKPLPEYYETICPDCKNKVVLITPKPLPKKSDYLQQYFKRLIEKEDHLKRIQKLH